MAEKLGVRLQEVKKDLEETIEKLEYKTEPICSIHAKCVIDTLTYKNENKKVELAALNASILMGNKILSSKRLIKILKEFLKVIEEELPIEEEIDILEDMILKSEISFSEGKFDLQQEIHSEARAIARLLVNNRK